MFTQLPVSQPIPLNCSQLQMLLNVKSIDVSLQPAGQQETDLMSFVMARVSDDKVMPPSWGQLIVFHFAVDTVFPSPERRHSLTPPCENWWQCFVLSIDRSALDNRLW